tara:strand:+ start:3954 stop:4373 length:420 start_codon:yes stop_codon:yes gene_type:complete
MSKPLHHKHLIVRAEVLETPTVEVEAEAALSELISAVGMVPMIGPLAKYCPMEGNEGITAVAIIETSHVVLHAWDACDPKMIQLDVYTCGELDPEIVFDWLKRFSPLAVSHKFIDREYNLKMVPYDRKTIYEGESQDDA